MSAFSPENVLKNLTEKKKEVEDIGQYDSLLSRNVPDIPEVVNAAGPDKGNYLKEKRCSKCPDFDNFINFENEELSFPKMKALKTKNEKNQKLFNKTFSRQSSESSLDDAQSFEEKSEGSSSREETTESFSGLGKFFSQYLETEEMEELLSLKTTKEQAAWINNRMMPRIGQNLVEPKLLIPEGEISIISAYLKETSLTSVVCKKIVKAIHVGEDQAALHCQVEVKDNHVNMEHSTRTIWRTHNQIKEILKKINYPKADQFPEPKEDLSLLSQQITEFFEQLVKEDAAQDATLQALLSHLPSDQSKYIVEIQMKKVMKLFFEGKEDLSDVSVSLFFLNKTNAISSGVRTGKTNELGEWTDETFYFSFNHEMITGLIFSVEKAEQVFAAVVAPHDMLFQGIIERNMPLHRTAAYPKKFFHGILSFSVHLHADSQVELPTPKPRVRPINPTQSEFRRKQRIQAEKIKKVGNIRIKYRYFPPGEVSPGALYVKVLNCDCLVSTVHTSGARENPSTYVCLETVYDGNRHCFWKWGKKGIPSKPPKNDQLEGVKLYSTIFRTPTVKDSASPVFNESFVFIVLPHSEFDPFFLDINVWEHPPMARDPDDHIGSLMLSEHDLIRNQDIEKVLTLQGVVSENDFPKKVGASLADCGYEPHYPILFIPGFCSSALKVVQGDENFIGEQIWLSLTKLTQESKAVRAFRFSNPIHRPSQENSERSGDDSPSEGEETELEFKNRWLAHMCLSEDACSDPKGKSLRPVEGIPGIAYLAQGKLLNALSYVFGPVIEEMIDLGYEVGKNIFGASYDWRLPPHFSEIRDQYFSKLVTSIEDIVAQNEGRGVILVPHSMGVRTAQYFLAHAESHHGREWIDKHVHLLMPLGGPFLGAPKSVRGLLSGERLGLEAFLSEDDGLALARHIGATPFLFPVGCKYYFDPNLHTDNSFIFIQREGSDEHVPIPCDVALKDAGSEVQLNQFHDYYLKNPLFGGDHESECRAIQCPPVKRMICVYGYNLPTEVKYFYQKNKKGYYSMKSPKDKQQWPAFTITKGLGYEDDSTPQHFPKIFGGSLECKSGDGTVPYASLSFPLFWRDQLELLDMVELYGAEHREMLNNRGFWNVLGTVAAKQTSLEATSETGEHFFKPHIQKTPTYCRACGKIIMGKYNVALACSFCDISVHTDCLDDIPIKTCLHKNSFKEKMLQFHEKNEDHRKQFFENCKNKGAERKQHVIQEMEFHKGKFKEKKQEVKTFISNLIHKKDKQN